MDGMGWDILWVLVSPPLKRLLKGPPPSFPGFPPLGRQGYSKKQSSPRSRVYRRVHTDRSDPNYDIKILHRMLIETTEVGSCSKPQKEEVAQVHRRRKVLEFTECGRCSSPQQGGSCWKRSKGTRTSGFRVFEAIQRHQWPICNLVFGDLRDLVLIRTKGSHWSWKKSWFPPQSPDNAFATYTWWITRIWTC